MDLIWTDNLSVGNKFIDDEHKALFKLVGNIERAIDRKDYPALLQTLELFENVVHRHFQNEERIADVINYSFEQHRLEHRYVEQELRAMRAELAANSANWSASAVEYSLEFIIEWSIRHITEDDMQMKEVLQGYPYDFAPPEIKR
jgi:hemerythrin-like metal-binding protein